SIQARGPMPVSARRRRGAAAPVHSRQPHGYTRAPDGLRSIGRISVPGRSSVDLLRLLLRHLCRERQVFAVTLHLLLALTADHVAQELAHERLHRTVPAMVGEHIDLAEERIG